MFEWGKRTYVMGILNITPDSFSGDGLLQQEKTVQTAPTSPTRNSRTRGQAVAQAKQFAADGADIIDIGGESTRPGSSPITVDEELARVIPVIEAVKTAVSLPISIDTYRASVAEAALAAGASWINDVWGLRMDGRMAAVAAAANCPVVLMHNRSRPKDVAQEAKLGGRYVGIVYDDLIADIKRELAESVEMALKAGVAEANIILDPGVGFGKTVAQNLRIINELDQFKRMGFPILLGSSRKSFIGYTLNLPPDERLEGTAATIAIGIDRGADVVRVHDVKSIVRLARMTDAIGM